MTDHGRHSPGTGFSDQWPPCLTLYDDDDDDVVVVQRFNVHLQAD